MPVRVSGPPAGIRGAGVDLPVLRRRSRAMLTALGHSSSELSVALVDDREIRKLQHRQETEAMNLKAEKDLIVKLSDYPDCAPDTRHARLFTPFI